MSVHKMLSWTAVILWMLLIFSLSHQPASESSEMSSGITKVIIAAVEKVAPGLEEDFGLLEHVVRKNAHFFIYLILGILVANALRKSGVQSSGSTMAAAAICVCYAMSDELHQLFISGRSGEVRDVLIDSSGAAAGIIVLMIMDKLLCAKRNTRKAFNAQELQS